MASFGRTAANNHSPTLPPLECPTVPPWKASLWLERYPSQWVNPREGERDYQLKKWQDFRSGRDIEIYTAIHTKNQQSYFVSVHFSSDEEFHFNLSSFRQWNAHPYPFLVRPNFNRCIIHSQQVSSRRNGCYIIAIFYITVSFSIIIFHS